MKQVTAQPILRDGDWRRLLDVLRAQGEAINQAAEGILFNHVTVTGTYTAGLADHVIYVVPTGVMTVTLPPASKMLGKLITVKRANTTTHVITINTQGGNIDGGASTSLTTSYQSRRFHSDGANYFLV